MQTPERFEIEVMSDPDHEELISAVLCDGEFCFVISQEQGHENLRIAVYPRRDGQAWDFSVSELMLVLEKVKKRLWELRRTEG